MCDLAQRSNDHRIQDQEGCWVFSFDNTWNKNYIIWLKHKAMQESVNVSNLLISVYDKEI